MTSSALFSYKAYFPIWPNHETPGINEVGGMAVYFRKVPKIGLVTAIMSLCKSGGCSL